MEGWQQALNRCSSRPSGGQNANTRRGSTHPGRIPWGQPHVGIPSVHGDQTIGIMAPSIL